LILASGQILLDTATGQMVGGDIEAQTERGLKNLEGLL
jgi:enamine deaminase RidA (YjgF/YER057c/UK114 family)